MQPLFTSLQGHRCASSTVWKIASENSTGEVSASRAKFYSDLFSLNFSLLGICTSDWPILGGSYADMYTIFHAVIEFGGIFNILSASGGLDPAGSKYVYTLPGAPKKTLMDLFTFLRWDAEELLNNVSFVHAFLDTYIRYIFLYEQAYLSPDHSISNHVLYLVYSAWQGAFLRPYIGTDRSLASLDFLDETEANTDMPSQLEEEIEEPEEEDEEESNKTPKKRSGKAGKNAKGKDSGGAAKEPNLKNSDDITAKDLMGATSTEPDNDQNNQDDKGLTSSATKKQLGGASQYLSHETSILPDICICANATGPNPTASAPVTNYNRTGYHLNQITTLSCYNFGESRIPTYNEQTIPMTDTSSIKGQKIYKKEELCSLINRGLNTVLNSSWRYSTVDPTQTMLSRPQLSMLDKVVSDPIRSTFYSSLPPGVHPATRQRTLGDIRTHMPLMDQALMERFVTRHVQVISETMSQLLELRSCGQSDTPLALAEKIELHLLEVYNLFLCDNGLTGAGETLILTLPKCLFLLYSILSDEIGPFMESFLRYEFKAPEKTLSLRTRVEQIDIRIYHNLLVLSGHIFATVLPRLNTGAKMDINDSADNVYFLLSSQHIGNLQAIYENLLTAPSQKTVSLLVIIFASMIHRQHYILNNKIIYRFCYRRPLLFQCVIVTLLSNIIISPLVLDTLELLMRTEIAAESTLALPDRPSETMHGQTTFSSMELADKLQRFGTSLARRTYLVHNSLLLIRASIHNGRFDGQMCIAISTFLKASLLENTRVHTLFQNSSSESFSSFKLFRAALISTCCGCISVIRPLVVSDLSAELHVLLLELVDNPSVPPAEVKEEIDSILADKVK